MGLNCDNNFYIYYYYYYYFYFYFIGNNLFPALILPHHGLMTPCRWLNQILLPCQKQCQHEIDMETRLPWITSSYTTCNYIATIKYNLLLYLLLLLFSGVKLMHSINFTPWYCCYHILPHDNAIMTGENYCSSLICPLDTPW